MPKEHKFLITNSAKSDYEFWVYSAFDFMWPELEVAANEHYEVYNLLYKSIEEDGEKINCHIAKVTFNNVGLLKKIIFDEKILNELTRISESCLATNPLTIEGQRVFKHDPKKFPFSLARVSRLVANLKNPEIIAYLKSVASQEPTVPFDETLPLLVPEKMPSQDLKTFLKKDDVVYLRYAEINNDAAFHALKQLESQEIKFPVSPDSMRFNDKLVVAQDPELKANSLPITVIKTIDNPNLIAEIKDFYQRYGKSEGLVFKPYIGGSGNAITILDPGIADGELDAKIAEIIEKTKQAIATLPESYFASCEEIIVQQRLRHLTLDPAQPSLLAGDIRFTAINGELVGAALRYSEANVEKILSFEKTKSLLPDNKSFTRENIAEFIAKYQVEQDVVKAQYYENLLQVHEVATKVTKWCKDHGHFHIGFDVLLGRDSEGKWTFCLTELNNIWPDCIPETRRINCDNCESPEKIYLCDAIVDLVRSKRYISPSAPSLAVRTGEERAVKKLKIDSKDNVLQ